MRGRQGSLGQSGLRALQEFEPVLVALSPAVAPAPLDKPVKGAHGALRNATAVRHRTLEGVLPLAVHPLELALYCRALYGFEIFLQAWEPLLRSALPSRLHAWLTTRSRYEHVRDDLKSLPCELIEISSSLREACVASVHSIELGGACATHAAFGSMYVMEGSALGGQVIAKVARDSLDIRAHDGGAYFNGFGAATGARWRGFLDLLNAEVGSGVVPCAAASRAAEQTFDALIRIFTMLRDDPASA